MPTKSKSAIDSELVKAYTETVFHVFNPSIEIRIGTQQPLLDKLLAKQSCSQWAFITPYNPASVLLSDAENKERMVQLLAVLKGYLCYYGEGRGTDPAWLPEQSVLILGISQAKANKLGRAYGQLAIVTGSINKSARLVLLQ